MYVLQFNLFSEIVLLTQGVGRREERSPWEEAKHPESSEALVPGGHLRVFGF